MENATPALGTDLYRFYDADGTLLYIGISKSAIARMAQHADDKSWWHDVARMEVERIAGQRRNAEQAERHAIATEKPKHNIVHNTGSPRPVKPTPKNRWTCMHCHNGAHYFQYHYPTGELSVVCDHHDKYPPGLDGGVYWVDLTRRDCHMGMQTAEDIADWERHLLEKDWFYLSDWAELKRLCLDAKPNSRRVPLAAGPITRWLPR